MRHNEVNYELLTNKLSDKGMCKFVNLYDIEDLKCPTKKEMQEKIRELTGEGRLFGSIPLQDFIGFYKDTEEAGQKHFYFYVFNDLEKYWENIQNFKTQCVPEDKRKFNTVQDNEWFFHEDNESTTFKVTSIKKIYQHNKDLDYDSKEGRFYKGFNVYDIHNIMFFRFIKSKNIVIIGIDKYSDLDREGDIKRKIFDAFDLICGTQNVHFLLEGLIDSERIENLLSMPNAISSKIKNTIDKTKQSYMKATRADAEKILKDLEAAKYGLDQVKEKNSEFDIKTHPTYLAEQEYSFKDKLTIDIFNTEIYWFTHKYKDIDWFRFSIDTQDSKITTYSPSITKQEFEDVILQII